MGAYAVGAKVTRFLQAPRRISFSPVFHKPCVARFPQTRIQALATPSEKQMARELKVPWRPGSWGLLWKAALLVYLRVVIKPLYCGFSPCLSSGNYGCLNADFQNSRFNNFHQLAI
jgi:hypothetical protein